VAGLPGLALEQEIAPPRRELRSPGLDHVDVEPRPRQGERRSPAIITVMPHRHALPSAGALGTPAQRRGRDLMTVAENVGPDLDRLAGNALDGKAPAIDGRINILDDEPF